MAKPHRPFVVGLGLVVSLAFGPMAVCGDDQPAKRATSSGRSRSRLAANLEREGTPESFKLPVDAKAQKTLEQAQDLIKGEDWRGAILLLQGLLDSKENPFVQLKGQSSDGQVIGPYTAAKAAANRLIGSLAPKSRQLYEKMQGAAAKKLLTQAKEKNNDPAMLAEGAERYRHTEAGAEALARLTRGKIAAAKTAAQAEWPMFAGDPARSAQGQGSAPIMTMQWKHLSWRQFQVESWLKQAAHMLENRGLPVIPAFSPITATIERDGKPMPLVIFRSYSGIHAVDCKNGKLEWESLLSMWSIGHMVRDPPREHFLSQWLNVSAIFENSTLGTLSRDDSMVYAVDDLQLLPHRTLMMQMQFNNGRASFEPFFGDALYNNRLWAFDLETGKLLWELGGRGPESGELGDSYFLGPPLPLDGKLYVLNEKNSELRLVCLDPKKNINENEKPILWIQRLGTVREKLLLDVGRRIQAAHIASGDDILVCPTNAGAILAVDLITHSPLWAYSYRKAPPAEPDEQNLPVRRRSALTPRANPAEWKVSAPVIQDGKVVFAAPDHDSVLCLNLRDGSRLWDAKRNDDVYLGGVYNRKVLLVGKSTCRALSLKDGQQLWKLETGLPSGRGVASDNVYYLPLEPGARSRAPEVCAIDIEKGAIVGHSKRSSLDGGAEVPGNLLFFADDVISQSVTGVTAFPQLQAALKEIDIRLKQNPHDPSGLSRRGELRLTKGDPKGAVEDLRAALANHPGEELVPRIREKMFEALTELLQRDFKAGEKYLKEFKELSEIPIPEGASLAQSFEEERQRRQSQYFILLGRGREMQGRLVEAFSAYLEFGHLTPDQELLTVPGETGLKVRPSTWAAGRIQAMLAKADPGQRQSLENRIDHEWKAVQQAKDTNRLNKFMSTFGSFLPVSHEARLDLAERLAKGDDFLKAELYLLTLSKDENPQVAGRAIEALASLMVRKGLLEDAGYYYRILNHDFARTVIRDGKTGADFFNDLATDKRFVSLLDEPRSPWSGGSIKVREVYGNFGQSQGLFFFDPQGETLPFFRRHRLAMDPNSFVRLIDLTTEQERWTQQIGNRAIAFTHSLSNQNLRWTLYHVGHLIVISTGEGAYGLDPIGRQSLWGKQLLDPAMGQYQIQPDPDGTLQILYADGSVQPVGRTGPVGPTFVSLVTRQGLVALEPLRGNTLWTRSDVSPRAHLFGDNRHLFVIEVDATGKVTGQGRAFRASDGASLPVADFGSLYQRRLRTVEGKLLLAETAAKGDLILRYYDVLTGKDLWKRTFTANTLVLKTDDTQLTGVIEPKNEGKVTVVDLRTFKEVLSSRVDPKDLDKVQEAYLLGDQNRFYLALSQPPDRQKNPWGGPWPNVANGIHSVPVNGQVYAFDRKSNKFVWKAELSNQMLIVSQFQNLPMLLFTARTNKPVNQAGAANLVINVSTVKSIDKRNGKVLFDKEFPNDNNNFYALNVNLQAGTVRLIRHNQMIEHSWEK